MTNVAECDDGETVGSLGDLMDDMFTSNVEFALREQAFDLTLLSTSRIGPRRGGGRDGKLSVSYNMNIGSETETHLTGQIPWPVCHLLNWFMLAHPIRYKTNPMPSKRALSRHRRPSNTLAGRSMVGKIASQLASRNWGHSVHTTMAVASLAASSMVVATVSTSTQLQECRS